MYNEAMLGSNTDELIQEDSYLTSGYKQPRTFPPRPLHQLPFYHGILREGSAKRRLSVGGEFLVFLNVDKDFKPTVTVRDTEKRCYCFYVEQNSCGYFAVQKSDFKMKFYCIDQLIEFYVSYHKAVLTTNTGITIYFETPIMNRYLQAATLTENVDTIQQLSYYYDRSSHANVAEILKKDGDFIVQSDPKDTNAVHIKVRWGDSIKKLHMDNKQMKCFRLPKVVESDPDEFVNSLDDLLKSIIISRTVAGGVQLKKPVIVDTSLIGIEDKSYSIDSADYEFAQIISNGNYVSLGDQPPIPFFLLPYYHGKMKANEVNTFIPVPGNFILYQDPNNVLTLAVCDKQKGNTIFFHQAIRVSEKNFYIKPNDVEWDIRTVQELINYYNSYGLPIQDVIKDPQTSNYLFVPKTPVNNKSYQENYYLEKCKNVNNLSYYYASLEENKLKEMLKSNGDFLLYQNDDKELQVCVYWNESIKTYLIKDQKIIKRYLLPRADLKEPQEFVRNIDEYLKSHLRCGISFGGATIETPIKKQK